MNRLIITTLLIGVFPSMLGAQDVQSLGSARGHQVAVIDADRREWQGRLLEISDEAIIVEIDSAPQSFELSAIRRVDAHGDRVLDGFVKGAIVGAVIGSLAVGVRFAFQSALAYSLVGAGMDAMNRCHHTVYRARTTPVGVKISW